MLAQQLEKQVEELRREETEKEAAQREESEADWKAEQSVLKEKLRLVQVELAKKDEGKTRSFVGLF